MTRAPQVKPRMLPFAYEGLWRLGRWDELDGLLSVDYSLQGAQLEHSEAVARALLCVSKRKGDKNYFDRMIKVAQVGAMSRPCAASMESYARAYPLLVQLHTLAELKHGWTLCCDRVDSSNRSDELFGWKQRLKATTSHTAAREEILEVRRALYESIDSVDMQARVWYSLAKTAREEGHLEVCHRSRSFLRDLASTVIQAERKDFEVLEAYIHKERVQRAGMLREQYIGSAKGVHAALMELEPVEEVYKDILNAIDKSELLGITRRARAKRLLVATNLMAECGQAPPLELKTRYKQICSVMPNWDRGFFHLAKYYDHLMRRCAESDQAGIHSLTHRAIDAYGKSLRYGGYKHIYESLPRLLTIWFNHCERITKEINAKIGSSASSKRRNNSRGERLALAAASSSKAKTKKRKSVAPKSDWEKEMQGRLDEVNDVVLALKDDLFVYQWYTAIPQLVSRLCHVDEGVWNCVKLILTRIIETYPGQAMWHIQGVLKSKVKRRQERASDVLDYVFNPKRTQNKKRKVDMNAKRDAFKKLVKGMNHFYDVMIKTALHDVGDSKDSVLSMKSIMGSQALGKMLSRTVLVIPSQRFLTAVLPKAPIASERHTPFDTDHPRVVRLSEKAWVMNSKEKPKRIKMYGTDGLPYNFLCKNEKHGDLRKDSRMMEFGTVVNRLLGKDPQARRRKLRLRTFAVTCLNETCGLMEWVENTTSLRRILARLYAREGFSQIPLEARFVI